MCGSIFNDIEQAFDFLFDEYEKFKHNRGVFCK